MSTESVIAMVKAAPVHKPAVPGMSGWPAPVPLPDLKTPVPAFDAALLPAALRPWLCDIAERMQCPIDFVAVGALVAAGSLVGRRIGIRPQARTDWTELPNLWGAIVGSPSSKKSPALTEALAPLNRLAASAREVHALAMRAWDLESGIREAQRAALKSDIKDASRKNGKGDADALVSELRAHLEHEQETEPTERRYIVNDATVEKLGELLAKNPHGFLHYRDELVGWLRTMDREGHEGDRSFYLEAWNGKGSFTYDRIGRGTVHIESTCISVLGGIQPGPLSAYVAAAVRNSQGADGLMQRFQLIVYPDSPGDWRNVDRWPDHDAKNDAFRVFERLATLDAIATGARVDEPRDIPYLRFTPEALEVFTEWRTHLERVRLPACESEAFEAHVIKYQKLVPALALLFHLIDHGSGPVSEEAVTRALMWADYLEPHARRVYAIAMAPDLAAARTLTARIQAGKLAEAFTVRDVYRAGWSGLDQKAAQRAVDYLADHDWLRREERENGGRPTVAYAINPRLRSDQP